MFLLKLFEYQYFVHDLSAEFYIGIIALFFTCLGVWIGFKLTRKPTSNASSKTIVELIQPEKFDISKREYEVLQLIGQGLSNQEIAEKLFVSLNTVKTHTSNLFTKLDAKRRTQAIQRAKELGLLA